MATKLHNLSDYDANALPSADVLMRQHYAIVVADWNSEITYALAQGAIDTFLQAGVPESNIEVIHVPGTVELTYAVSSRYFPAKDKDVKMFSDKQEVNAVVAIGCVIQGDTPHFDYVCQSVTNGLTELNARGYVPVVFSVLTTLNKQQALDRAGGALGNKGVEGAYTAMRMANLKAE